MRTQRVGQITARCLTFVLLSFLLMVGARTARPSKRVHGATLQGAEQTIVRYIANCRECPKNVLDRGSWDFTLDVPQDACPGRLLDVDVAINIKHTWRGDITMRIQPPGWPAAPVELFSQVDSYGDHLGSGDDAERNIDRFLILDDEARFSLERSPCVDPQSNECYGRWKSPQRSLQRRVYDSSSRRAAGTWTLRVEDGAALDSGDVRDLKLLFECEGLPTPAPSATPSASGTPTSSSTPSATSTPRPRATATATDRATTTSTSTPSQSATATAVPVPLYIPLLVHDAWGCPPQHLFTDVVFVIDASTTMADVVGPSGSRKIDVATDVAWQFIDRYLIDGRSDQVGIVLFNATAVQRQVLTRDRNRLVEA